MRTKSGLILPDKMPVLGALPKTFNWRGLYKIQEWGPKRKSGTRELLWEGEAENGVTTEGKNHILDTVFGGGTQVDPWYIGLIDNSGSPTLAAADTLASHAGWVEETDYTGNRQAWVEAAASGGVMATTTAADFPFTANVDIYGVFLASVATGTSGTLMNTAALNGGARAFNSGSTMSVSYSASM